MAIYMEYEGIKGNVTAAGYENFTPGRTCVSY